MPAQIFTDIGEELLDFSDNGLDIVLADAAKLTALVFERRNQFERNLKPR